MAKHVHAEIIKAWADGAEIEYRAWPRSGPDEKNDGWVFAESPHWLPAYEYRVKPKPHKWQVVIDAWKAGKMVQWQYPSVYGWRDSARYKQVYGAVDMFDPPGFTWRVKPEKVVVDFEVRPDPDSPQSKYLIFGFTPGLSNLKLTFEDGKLIAAELLK